jgi:hypothetical protein
MEVANGGNAWRIEQPQLMDPLESALPGRGSTGAVTVVETNGLVTISVQSTDVSYLAQTRKPIAVILYFCRMCRRSRERRFVASIPRRQLDEFS